MRSGSPAQDDGSWPSPQRPHSGGATGNSSRFGAGARNEPQGVPGAGRREAPFGPEISWPYGFRPLDTESREVLESAYGAGPLNPRPGTGSVYQPPAMNDYGDPGYSDPSYDGPSYGGPSYGGQAYPAGQGNSDRPGSGGSGFSGGTAFSGGSSASGSGGFGTPRGPGGDDRRAPGGGIPGYRPSEPPRGQEPPRPGYQAPSSGAGSSGAGSSGAGSSGAGIWPVTGAQEALPDSGPQPSGDARRGSSRPGQASYPEQWYGHPRLEDRALEEPRRSRSSDPRLDGMTYGDLRYDDTGSFAAASSDGEPEPPSERLDDESWYQELRRSAPAYPQNPPAPGSPASGPQRRTEPPGPSGPASGSSSGGYPQGADRAPGFGQPRWNGPDRPQMSAGPDGSRPAEPGAQAPRSPAAQGAGFLSAPVASVGLLTPPGGTRVDPLRDGARPAAPAAPASSPSEATQATRISEVLDVPDEAGPRGGSVRPGHGLDGPSITASWPVQPAGDDLESYDDFWRDDADEEYTGLFGDREAEFQRAAAKQAAAAKRQTGRRRGRSNDHRLWLGLGGVVVIAAAAIAGIVKFEFAPSHSGPAHAMATPAKIGSFSRTMDLEHQADVEALKAKLIKMSAGQASHVVSAVYESGNSAAGNSTQIVMFIGGHLANADPAASVASFTQQFKGAKVVSPGPGGGKAACLQDGSVEALCAWFDNDSLGVVVSPTMNATALAKEMQAMRPSVETRAAS